MPNPTWVARFNQSLKAWHNTDPNSSQPVCFLATRALDGRPRVRTVGHADLKWSPEHGFFAALIGTDSRSPKAEHIKACPDVEVCYWFNDTKEQYRIAGKAFIVDSESSDALWLNERRRYFDTLLAARKKNYGREQAPGTPMGESPSHADQEPLPEDLVALNHYALIVIQCLEVDWISQTKDRRVKFTFDDSGEDEAEDPWKEEELLL